MSRRDPHPAIRRITRQPEAAAAVDLLGSDLPASDAVSLLLTALERRTEGLTPAAVLAQYGRDRFVAPGAVDPIRLARLELRALEQLASSFEVVSLSPLAPLGCHSALADVSQHRVVTTIRMSEVAADPTTQLALEAAERRRALLRHDPRSTEPIRLAATARVVRAQRFDGPRSFAHFSLLGAVVAGRSTGGHRFEVHAVSSLLESLVGLLTELSGLPIAVRLSDLSGDHDDVLTATMDRGSTGPVTFEVDEARTAGRGYYPHICFKLLVDVGSELVEIGDGGFVDWTQSLVQSRKERLLIGAVSLERLAGLAA